MATQRLVFSFDDGTLRTLKAVRETGDFPSFGTAVRESLQTSELLQDLVASGFTELIVRNPHTNKEKTIVVGSLQKLAKASTA